MNSLGDIAEDLRQLAPALFTKSWNPIRTYMAGAQISIKGRSCTIDHAERLLSFHTAPITDVEIVLEQVLNHTSEPDRVDLRVRVAALGRRMDDGRPDGVIMDCRLVFQKDAASWRLRVLEIECPPKWAQWNSRPNGLAPVHYGDPFWWDSRAARSQRSASEY